MKTPKKPYLGRDTLILDIIEGCTKAAIHTDKKKEKSRKGCRDWRPDQDE